MTSRLEALKDLLAQTPDDPELHYLIAQEYFSAGHHAECIREMELYLSHADDEGAAYRTLARAYEALGKREKARQAYTAGISAARKHNHPGMAQEFEEILQEWE